MTILVISKKDDLLIIKSLDPKDMISLTLQANNNDLNMSNAVFTNTIDYAYGIEYHLNKDKNYKIIDNINTISDVIKHLNSEVKAKTAISLISNDINFTYYTSEANTIYHKELTEYLNIEYKETTKNELFTNVDKSSIY